MARADTGAEEERPHARVPLLTPGEHVAGLEVGAVIGRGRRSTVHRAREVATGREVALEVLSAAPGAEASVRFVREFELARTLARPHIVPVYEHGSLPSAHDRAGAPG
jgi:serine/threonine protein kinase